MNKRMHTFFIYFLYSYILVIGIGAVAFLFVYIQSDKQITERAVESVSLQLLYGKDLTEARLEELEAGAYKITRTDDILAFMRVNAPLEPHHYYSLLRLRSEFEQFNLSSAFVDSVYLVFRKSGAVLSTYYANPDFRWLYPNFVQYEKLDFDQWIEWIDLWSDRTQLLPAMKVSLYRTSLDALTLRLPLPFASTEPTAALLALIPISSIRRHFQSLLDTGAVLTLTDRDGRELYTSKPAAGKAGTAKSWTDSALVVQNNDRSRWGIGYKVYVPQSYLSSQLYLVRVVFAVALLLTVFIGGMLAVFFALRNSKPMDRMLQLAETSGTLRIPEKKLNYATLSDLVERMVGKQTDIEKAVEKQNNLLRNGFYERILRRGFSVPSEIQEYTANLQLSFPIASMDILLITIHGSNGYDSPVDTLVHKYIESLVKPTWHHHKTREGEVLVVPDDSDSIRGLCGTLEEFGRVSGLRILAGMGFPRFRLIELADSFDEAVSALHTGIPLDSPFTLMRYSESGERNYAYTEEDRRKINSYINSGDEANLHGIIDAIKRANFIDNELATPTRLQLIADLSATAKTIINAVAEKADTGQPAMYAQSLARYHSADDFFERLKALLTIPCSISSAANKGNSRVVSTISQVKEYIDGNYGDASLCLTSMAERFGMNSQYLCRSFHEYTGETFSGYIERTRMKAATELMAGDNPSLKLLAMRVGYANWNSFYKAFKRYFGVSPKDYLGRGPAAEGAAAAEPASIAYQETYQD